MRCVSARGGKRGLDQMRRTAGRTGVFAMQHSSPARAWDVSLTESWAYRDGTKFDSACAAESLFIGPAEVVGSLRAAAGKSREPQARIASTPVRGAWSSAAKELWQPSLCVDDEPAHAREPQSEAQSGARSNARRVRVAMVRRRKCVLGRIFIVNTQRYAGTFVESNRPSRAVFAPSLAQR